VRTEWKPDGWRSKPTIQMPEYPDQDAVKRVEGELLNYPPLVFAGEARNLKAQLGEVAEGRAFLLQGGDCAESFAEFHPDNIRDTFRVLLQMAVVLTFAGSCPVVKVGRLAGQFAKPRSNLMESINETCLPSYRGDLINEANFSKAARTPNPWRMLEGYNHAAITLNYLRALINGGFASINNTNDWALTATLGGKNSLFYANIRDQLQQAITLIENLNEEQAKPRANIDFFTSHEALLLPYESALTRKIDNRWYNLSTHYPWVGMRTSDLVGAHIDYLSGIANPVAIKIGPSATASWLCAVLDKLNPSNEPGKITLVTRFGAEAVEKHLPPLINAVQQSEHQVLWLCDPMHGNTETTMQGKKTRHVTNITAEIARAWWLHQEHGSILGGVHLELTGENVTECIGGLRQLSAEALHQNYCSLVDPRLNYEQSLEVALQIAKQSAQKKPSKASLSKVVTL